MRAKKRLTFLRVSRGLWGPIRESHGSGGIGMRGQNNVRTNQPNFIFGLAVLTKNYSAIGMPTVELNE
jgi:hypothetical protein